MTNYDETAGTDDPQSLLLELKSRLAGEGETSERSDELTENELWGDRELDTVTFIPSAVVSAAVDLVIPPREPRPELRSKMIAAASRALAERRKVNGLLPVLLRAERESNGMSIGDVAEKAGLSESEIGSLESGKVAVDQKLLVETTVAWIRAVPVDHDRALDSLRRSLRVGWMGDQILAAGLPHNHPTSVEDYVSQVAGALEVDNENGSR
jgi:hypothetical protein